jgi:hypothetical protein
LWLVCLNADDDRAAVPHWLKGHIEPADQVLLLRPRGDGEWAWSRQSPPNAVERSLALLGRTADAGRVWDVQAVARWYHENDPGNTPILVGGRGRAGVIAAYATIFEPCINEVVLHQPSATHRSGPIFLNVLRRLDVPDSLGLLAPRRLVLQGVDPAHFTKTRDVYRAAGAGERLTLP